MTNVGAEGLDETGETLGEGDRPASFQKAMDAGSGEYDRAPAGHNVSYPKLKSRYFLYEYFDRDLVLEGGRPFVRTMDLGNRRDHAFGLHLLETVSDAVQHVYTGLLHETDIVGMVRHAHTVALVILDFVDIRFNHNDLEFINDTAEILRERGVVPLREIDYAAEAVADGHYRQAVVFNSGA